MVKTYRKGYMGERHLVHELYKLGYAVVRTPHSGCIGLPSPDIIAIKGGRVVVVECKAREKAFKVSNDQIEELKVWQSRANAVAYIAWKISYKGWFFLPLDIVEKNSGNVNRKMLEFSKTITDI